MRDAKSSQKAGRSRARPKPRTRVERDSLGRLAVPADAYFGVQTQRAVANFPISGLRAHPALVAAAARVKKAAAAANARLGLLDRRRSAAIVEACGELASGKLAPWIVVDVFQMGAGTSFHMNVNEVLANRAEELLGGRKGEYRLVHPNDHVNMGQSTNDVFPTAMRVAALTLIRDDLDPALVRFERSLAARARAFDRVLKSGRTHLQDAVPVRLGQEFAAYAAAVRRSRLSLRRSAAALAEIGLGGSAVGTGLNTHPRYAALAVRLLAADAGLALTPAADLRESMQSLQPFAAVSGALRNLALELTRIANDLRLLASGPRTGLAEIRLPPVAPGSSIMPGKVNPSMLEMLNQVCFQVIGCDLAVAAAVQAGQLELNVMMPVVAFNLPFMISILSAALRETASRAVDGITADTARCLAYAEASPGLATALSPLIGYAAAASVAGESLRTGKTPAAVALERGLLEPGALARLMDPRAMTEPGIPAREVRTPASRRGARSARPRRPSARRAP